MDYLLSAVTCATLAGLNYLWGWHNGRRYERALSRRAEVAALHGRLFDGEVR